MRNEAIMEVENKSKFSSIQQFECLFFIPRSQTALHLPKEIPPTHSTALQMEFNQL